MNIICILAGGTGNRFQSAVPKQYHSLSGRPVIEYVVDAALKSCADETLVVCANNYAEQLADKYGVCTVHSGHSRNDSMVNAINFVKEKYPCKNILFVDAVCPTLTPELIDLYFEYLGEYDAVFTTSEITTSIAHKNNCDLIDGHELFLIKTPDAYRFSLICECMEQGLKGSSPYYNMPSNAKIKCYSDFLDHIKIIYPQDIAIAETLLREKERQIHFKSHSDDTVLNLLRKLRKIDSTGTRNWEKTLDKNVETLFSEYGVYEFNVNRDAYTGLVIECASRKYGAVIIKMYPDFLRKRYVKESYVMKNLNNYHQCKMIACNDSFNAMLLERIVPGDYIEIECDKVQIEQMFIDMNANRKRIDDLAYVEPEIKGVLEQTIEEYEIAKEYDYHPKMIKYLLDKAKEVYDYAFYDDEKYLLHGDVYFKNALRGNNEIKVIDPVGYKDSFVFEYMPFLTYELYQNSKSINYLRDYRELVKFFNKFADTTKFKEATYVFLIKQIVPSIYEANDNYKRANKYMDIIKALYLNESNQFEIDKFGE